MLSNGVSNDTLETIMTPQYPPILKRATLEGFLFMSIKMGRSYSNLRIM